MKNLLLLLLFACIASTATSQHHNHATSALTGVLKATSAHSIGAPFALTTTGGKPFTEKNLIGTNTLIFFGFTNCDNECPQSFQLLADTYSQLTDKQREKLKVIMVSVDPDRDTPAKLESYTAQFNPSFQSLTGTHAQIRTALKSFLAYAAVEAQPQNHAHHYQVAHSTFIYLIDEKGQYRQHFRHTEDTATLLGALRKILP